LSVWFDAVAFELTVEIVVLEADIFAAAVPVALAEDVRLPCMSLRALSSAPKCAKASCMSLLFSAFHPSFRRILARFSDWVTAPFAPLALPVVIVFPAALPLDVDG
jgi:hypothetical protein